MAHADILRILELVVSLFLAGFLFVWVRPSFNKSVSALVAGVLGGLFLWVAGIYFHRWGIWTPIAASVNLRSGSYTIDLMHIPLLVPVSGFFWTLVLCFLVELPATTSSGSKLQRYSPKTWVAIIVSVGTLFGAMATTLNCGLSGSTISQVGSLTFFAALPFWFFLQACGLFVYSHMQALLVPGSSIFVR